MSHESIAWAELQQAIVRTDPACLGDDRFVGNGQGGVHTSDLARLCSSCPIFTECDTYARTLRPHRIAGFWASRWRGRV